MITFSYNNVHEEEGDSGDVLIKEKSLPLESIDKEPVGEIYSTAAAGASSDVPSVVVATGKNVVVECEQQHQH